MNDHNHTIMITGYSFAMSHLSKWVDYYPYKKELVMVIPKGWIGRGGRVIFERENLGGVRKIYCWAFRMNKYWPGLYFFKGFMPGFLIQALKVRPKIIYNGNEVNLFYTLFTMLIAKIIKARHICFMWENIPYQKKLSGFKLKFTEWVVKANIKGSYAIVCGSKKAENIARFYGAGNTFVMPLGGVEAERLNIPREDHPGIVFLFSGELDKRKGVDIMLAAFAEVISKIPEARLMIVGNGKMREELYEFVNQHNLKDCVNFLSWLPNSELPRIFAKADIFLYPSVAQKGWEEQFGYSMVEAMAAGLPVISTNTGSISEVVPKGAGLLVRAGDYSDLAQAMLKLALNKELRLKMGEFGRNWVLANYSNKIIAQKYYNLFHR